MSREASKPVEVPLDLDMNCRGCGSDQHTKYTEVRSEDIDGQRITWKRTQCTHCSQFRINRFGTPLKDPAPAGRRRG